MVSTQNVSIETPIFAQQCSSVIFRWLQVAANVVFESSHTSGGHFAAHERPQELVDDLRKMYGKDGPAHRVVPGHSGYAH